MSKAGVNDQEESVTRQAREPFDRPTAADHEAGRRIVKVEFADDRADEAVGQTLGRYKVLQKIGEGGCGVVYMAEQEQPVRCRVALKVIKLGMPMLKLRRVHGSRSGLATLNRRMRTFWTGRMTLAGGACCWRKPSPGRVVATRH